MGNSRQTATSPVHRSSQSSGRGCGPSRPRASLLPSSAPSRPFLAKKGQNPPKKKPPFKHSVQIFQKITQCHPMSLDFPKSPLFLSVRGGEKDLDFKMSYLQKYFSN